MKPFMDLSVIHTWGGFKSIYDDLTSSGFFTHEKYLLLLHASCESTFWQENLLHYLEEVAKECLSSGATEGYRGVHRHREGFFKSEYLDSLEAKFGVNCEIGNNHSGKAHTFVHPAVKFVDDMILKMPHDSRVSFINSIEIEKEQEYELKHTACPPWTGKRSEFEKYLNATLHNLDFYVGDARDLVKVDAPKKWYFFSSGQKTRFCCGFNVSYPGKIFGQLPLSFWVDIPNEKISLPLLGSLDLYKIVPGLSYYAQFGRLTRYAADIQPNPIKSVIIGIEAISTAYKALAKSVDA